MIVVHLTALLFGYDVAANPTFINRKEDFPFI